MNPIERWEQARSDFASLLLNWRLQHGLSGQFAEDCARAAPDLLPAKILNSTWTGLEKARNTRTAPQTFLALGLLNVALASGELVARIHDRTLKDRAIAADPIRHADGRPWTDQDFYAAFMGHLPVPERYLSREITREKAADLSEEWRREFRKQCIKHKMAPAPGFADMMQNVTAMDQSQVDRLQEVLFGFTDYEPEELAALRVDGLFLPYCLITDWS